MSFKKGNRASSGLSLDNRYNSYLHQGDWKICQRKATRVDIQYHDLPVYISYPELNSHLFSVQMIAEFGARFFTQPYDVRTLVGHRLNCVLHLGDQKFPLQSRMVLLSQNMASIEFLNPPLATRNQIKQLFEPELMAARLAPFHSFRSMVAGPSHTTIYSDGKANTIELMMKNESLEAFKAELQILGVKYSWTRQGLKVFDKLFKGRLQNQAQRNRLISFISNLPDLTPEIRKDLERAIRL